MMYLLEKKVRKYVGIKGGKPMDSILSLIITGALPLIGVIIGIFLPHRLNIKSTYKTFRQGKLEELYDDITKWINNIIGMIINFNLVFKKAIDWNKYLDNITENGSNKEINFFKSEIIICLYYKELEEDFNKLTLSIQDLTKFINNDIKTVYLAGHDINILGSEYDKKVKNICALAEILKEKIKDTARNI